MSCKSEPPPPRRILMEETEVKSKPLLPQRCKDPCLTVRDCGYGIGSWGWLVAFLLVLVALIVFWWVILYSANPTWVQTDGVTDTTKVLLWAVILAFVVSMILVVFKVIYDKFMCKGLC